MAERSPVAEVKSRKMPRKVDTIRICMVGGKRIVRLGIASLLKEEGLVIETDHHFDSEEDFARYMEASQEVPFDLILLILSGGPFTTIHHIRETLAKADEELPLVILSYHIGRGQVYAALRIGAKAYLDLDSEPAEVAKAIKMASENKVFLAPEVAELLVNDMSAAYEPAAKTQRLPSVDLSRREVEIVQLLCEGLSSKEIARRLHLSTKTIENHRYNIYRKCEVDSIAALMRHAIQHGLITI